MCTIAGPWPLTTRWAKARRAATRRHRHVGVHDPDVVGAHQLAEAGDPGDARRVAGVEAVDGNTVVADLVDERVLPREQVGDFGPEARRIEVSHRARDQPLGAAQPEALGQHQHADRVPIRTRIDPHAVPAVTTLVRDGAPQHQR